MFFDDKQTYGRTQTLNPSLALRIGAPGNYLSFLGTLRVVNVFVKFVKFQQRRWPKVLIFLASVCVEPKGTHLPDRKALGKIKCAVSVRLLPAVNKRRFFSLDYTFATIKLPIVTHTSAFSGKKPVTETLQPFLRALS